MDNNYYQKYLKYKNKYLLLKNQIKGGAYTTSLCVNNVYHQHEGECWHDAISMILHFSDDIKDIIQPQLYNKLSEDEIKIKQQKDLFLPIDLDHDKIDIYYENVFKYLESISERFINHYDNDKLFDIKNYIGNYEGYDRLDEITKIPLKTKSIVARQKSIQRGVESAVCISQIFNDLSSYPIDIYKNHAGGNHDYLNIINIYNQFFLAPSNKYITMHVFPFGYKNIFKTLYTQDYFKYLYDNSFAMTIGIGKYRSYSNHVISIFKCNNQFYYYDDNFGTFPIDITEIINCIDKMNLDTEHLRIKYDHTADSDKKYKKLTNVQFLNINKDEPLLNNMEIVFDIEFFHLENKMDDTYIKYQKLNSELNIYFADIYLAYNIDKDIEHYFNDPQFNYLKLKRDKIYKEIEEITEYLKYMNVPEPYKTRQIEYFTEQIQKKKNNLVDIISKNDKIKKMLQVNEKTEMNEYIELNNVLINSIFKKYNYNMKTLYEMAIEISKDNYDLYYVLLGCLICNYYDNFDSHEKVCSMLYSREYPPDKFLLSLCNKSIVYNK
jgi:hypothetical protein